MGKGGVLLPTKELKSPALKELQSETEANGIFSTCACDNLTNTTNNKVISQPENSTLCSERNLTPTAVIVDSRKKNLMPPNPVTETKPTLNSPDLPINHSALGIKLKDPLKKKKRKKKCSARRGEKEQTVKMGQYGVV